MTTKDEKTSDAEISDAETGKEADTEKEAATEKVTDRRRAPASTTSSSKRAPAAKRATATKRKAATKRAPAAKRPAKTTITSGDDASPDVAEAEAEQSAPSQKAQAEPAPGSPTSRTSAVLVEPDRRTQRRWLRRVVKTLFLLAVVAGLAAGAWAGWPTVRDRYITPVQTSTADLATVRTRLDEIDRRQQELEATASGLGDSLTDLSTTLDETGEAIGVLEGRVAATEGSIVSQTERIATLETTAQELSTAISDADEFVAQQVEVLLATEYLSRARLFLYQANYGLAGQDVEAAMNLLSALPVDPVRSDVIDRLESVQTELPDRPVLAADDLDIAWYALLGGSSTFDGE